MSLRRGHITIPKCSEHDYLCYLDRFRLGWEELQRGDPPTDVACRALYKLLMYCEHPEHLMTEQKKLIEEHALYQIVCRHRNAGDYADVEYLSSFDRLMERLYPPAPIPTSRVSQSWLGRCFSSQSSHASNR